MDNNTYIRMIDNKEFKALRQELIAMDPAQVALLLEEVPPDKAVMGFRLLPKNMAVEVFDWFDAREQQVFIKSFTDSTARALLEAMPPDDRAELLEEVPAIVARRLIQLLPPEDRRVTLDLLGYSEGTAGRLMTPEFVDLRSEMTVGRAFERIRKLAVEKETIYELYVIDGGRRLKGTVSLKELVVADPGTRIEDIMKPNPLNVSTDTDQEAVSRILLDNELLAVPVVDTEGRLVGIVTWDDIADVVEEETTEDIYRFGAVHGTERSYFTSRILNVVKQRVVWLLLLIVVNTATAAIIAGQSKLIGEIVILAAFIPLLIGTGGNIGAQSATVIIRGMATGEVNPRRAAGTIARESSIGIILGIILGIAISAWALVLGRDPHVAAAVGTTVIGVSIMGTIAGGALPFLFRWMKLDPALVSAPFITTIMDVGGLLLYFFIARMVLRI